MTDDDGHRIEAAEQFGFEWTNDDADEYSCTEAQLIAFAKAAERKGRAEAIALLKQTPAHLAVLRILRERNDVADAELLPILEAERVRSLTAAGYVRGTDGRWNKPERLCDDEGCPHYGTDHVCINRVEKDCEVCGGDCAAANPPVINCPRDECARRGIDPDELCADGGVTAEMVVAKEIGAGCGQAVITPWQTPAPCGGRIGLEWRTLRREIMRLIRDEFDPTPANWKGRDWNDNAEDTADKILAAVKIAMRSEVVRKDFV